MVKRLRSALVGFFSWGAPTAALEPAGPAGKTVYAVGDIHGDLGTLDRLLALIAADIAAEARGDAWVGVEVCAGGETRERPLVIFLGDYVDRGAESAAVLDRLCADPVPGAECRFLIGNHEAAMLGFLEDPAANAEWLSFGGAETLASYGIRASVGISSDVRCRALRDQLAARVPDRHRAFLGGLDSHHILSDYMFVHAGIQPGRALDRQHRDDLLWIREPFLSSRRSHPKVVVHGHTIVDAPEFWPNRIAIDTGAYATGILTALVIRGIARRIIQT